MKSLSIYSKAMSKSLNHFTFNILFIIIHYKDLAGFNLLTQSTKHDSLNHRQSKTFFLPS